MQYFWAYFTWHILHSSYSISILQCIRRTVLSAQIGKIVLSHIGLWLYILAHFKHYLYCYKWCLKCAKNVQSQPNMGKHYAALCASVAKQEKKNNLSVSSWSQTKIMSIQPALWRCFVHEGGKLENRQFVTKMHQIAPSCVSNFIIFPGVIPRTPYLWEGDTPFPDLFPASHNAGFVQL